MCVGGCFDKYISDVSLRLGPSQTTISGSTADQIQRISIIPE